MTSPVFGTQRGDAILAEAELQAARAAFQFIRRGLRDMTGMRATASVDVLELMVNNKLSDAALGNGLLNRPQLVRNRKAWDAAQERALAGLMTDFVRVAKHHFGSIAAPWLGVPQDDEAEKRITTEVTGRAPAPFPDAALKASEPLEYALQMAQYNRLRAEQRIVLLYVLAAAVRGMHRSELSVPAAEQEFVATSSALWLQHKTCEFQVFALSVLRGGDALEARKVEAQKMYGDGMSVQHLIELDGALPGRWLRDEEHALRAAIKSA